MIYIIYPFYSEYLVKHLVWALFILFSVIFFLSFTMLKFSTLNRIVVNCLSKVVDSQIKIYFCILKVLI